MHMPIHMHVYINMLIRMLSHARMHMHALHAHVYVKYSLRVVSLKRSPHVIPQAVADLRDTLSSVTSALHGLSLACNLKDLSSHQPVIVA